MEWLNFRHLFAFWMVCRHGGFKHAAQRMFIAQSAVSEHVAQLEQYFDARLFDRSTRRVTLTHTGRKLLAYADVIFSQSREINQVIREKKDQDLPEVLRVGIVGGISRNFLFSRLAGIMDSHPEIEVDVLIGAYDELYDMLRNYELDLALSTEIPDRKHLNHLAYSCIGSTPLCLVGHPEVMEKMDSLQTNLYVYRYPYEGDFVAEVLCEEMGLNLKRRLETDDISLLRFFANSGEGLVVMPMAGALDDIKSGRVVSRPLKRAITINFYGICIKDTTHPLLIRRLFHNRTHEAEAAGLQSEDGLSSA